MKRTTMMISMLALIGAGQAATAQTSSGDTEKAKEKEKKEAASARPADPAAQGIVNGVVAAVDVATGGVTLDTSDGQMTLNGTPHQVAALRPGQKWQTHFIRYGSQLWLAEDPAQSGRGIFSPAANVTGRVQSVDAASGLITLVGPRERPLTFATHARTAEGFAPGQQLSVTYQNVDGVPWLLSAGPAAGSASGDPAAPTSNGQPSAGAQRRRGLRGNIGTPEAAERGGAEAAGQAPEAGRAQQGQPANPQGGLVPSPYAEQDGVIQPIEGRQVPMRVPSNSAPQAESSDVERTSGSDKSDKDAPKATDDEKDSKASQAQRQQSAEKGSANEQNAQEREGDAERDESSEKQEDPSRERTERREGASGSRRR